MTCINGGGALHHHLHVIYTEMKLLVSLDTEVSAENSSTQERLCNDMATASSFLCEEQFECPICTELFKNPVSLPCGHNFCDACIRRHWRDKERHQCPLCKQEIDTSLKLCVNTLFRDIVDSYKQDHVSGDGEKPISPEDVLCDCCLHTRRRAAKTCLVCLTSYCKAHLEPHRKVATLKTHKLTDAVPKLEEKTCAKHNRILEESSSSDKKPVCVLCACDAKTQPEKQYEDKHYIKVKNPKRKKKTKHNNLAPKTKMTEEETEGLENETEGLENIHIWHNDNLYTFSPLPLQCGFSSGRVYYDVPIVVNSDWELGVVNEKLRGNRVFSTKPYGRWVISYNRHVECSAGCPINKIKVPDRILVCVDYKQGLMFLVHPLDGIVVLCLSNCRFKGKLFLFSHHSHTRENVTSAKWTRDDVFLLFMLFLCFAYFIQ